MKKYNLLFVFLFFLSVSLFSQSPGVEDFFRRELCPPGSTSDECQLVRSFSSDDNLLSVAIVEDFSFRASAFGFALRTPDGLQLIGAGPLIDLEVMAYSPSDPFAFENYPTIWAKVGDVQLFDLLVQVAEYFDDLYEDS